MPGQHYYIKEDPAEVLAEWLNNHTDAVTITVSRDAMTKILARLGVKVEPIKARKGHPYLG